MDFQQCTPDTRYAPVCDNRLQNSGPTKSQRYSIIALLTGFMVVIVYAAISMHLNTKHSVEKIQTELSGINRELSRVAEKYNGGNNHRHDDSHTKQPTVENTSHPHPADVENLVRKYTARLQTEMQHTTNEIQRLRSGIEAIKVDAALHSPNGPHPLIDRFDYALESVGGSVMHTGASRLPGGFLAYLLGVRSATAPRRIIQATAAIGECFAFFGAVGEIVLRLQQRVFVEAISVDHIRAEMAPYGQVHSAPKQFSVYGLEESTGKQHYFGNYEYKIGTGRPQQLFEIPEAMRAKTSFDLMHFRFLSNHGNEEYTCVYQVKVHGRPDASVAPVKKQVK